MSTPTENPPRQPVWERPKRAQRTCDVSEATINRWIKSGTVRTKKIGGVRYVDVSERKGGNA